MIGITGEGEDAEDEELRLKASAASSRLLCELRVRAAVDE